MNTAFRLGYVTSTRPQVGWKLYRTTNLDGRGDMDIAITLNYPYISTQLDIGNLDPLLLFCKTQGFEYTGMTNLAKDKWRRVIKIKSILRC